VKHAQDRLAHASAATTMDVYTHSIGEEGRKYAAAVEAAFPFSENITLSNRPRLSSTS
jgi:hypothetical protein